MRQYEALALTAQLHQDYPRKVTVQVTRTAKQKNTPPGGGWRVKALLTAPDAPALAKVLRYPSQAAKLAEQWCWWLLTPEQLAALPFPGPDKEDEDELAAVS